MRSEGWLFGQGTLPQGLGKNAGETERVDFSPELVLIEVVAPDASVASRILRSCIDDVASRYYGRQATDHEIDASLRDTRGRRYRRTDPTGSAFGMSNGRQQTTGSGRWRSVPSGWVLGSFLIGRDAAESVARGSAQRVRAVGGQFLPLLLVRGSGRLDRKLRLPRFRAGRVNRIAGASLGVAGVSFALWSIGLQMTVGSGTPLPMMPTQRLVVKPPFTRCRNPMTLGTMLGGLGVGVWIGSFSAIAIAAALGTALLAYVRFIEEKELDARFGQDYVDYKRTTPFLLPRMRRRVDGHRPCPGPRHMGHQRWELALWSAGMGAVLVAGPHVRN